VVTHFRKYLYEYFNNAIDMPSILIGKAKEFLQINQVHSADILTMFMHLFSFTKCFRVVAARLN